MLTGYLFGVKLRQENQKGLKDMTKTNYQRNELIDLIEDQCKGDYAIMSGSLRAALASVLIQVEVEDPKLFQKIMQFEMDVQEQMSKDYF